MKKFSTILLFATALLFSVAGFSQSKTQYNRMKQRLVKELNITNAKADSVLAIVQEYVANARSTKQDANMSDSDRKLALQNNRKQELARLRTHLNNQQIKKLQQMVTEIREQRQGRRTGADSTEMQ